MACTDCTVERCQAPAHVESARSGRGCLNCHNNHLSNLTYGTHRENEDDKWLHGTRTRGQLTHCSHGHEYDVDNTRIVDGIKYCRACQRDKYARNATEYARIARERRARKRAELLPT